MGIKLLQIIERAGVDFKQTPGSDEVRVCCPSCGEEKYRLYLNLKKKQGICFRCGEGGGVWKFLRQLGVKQVPSFQIAEQGSTLIKEPEPIRIVKLPPDAVPLHGCKSAMAEKARAYLIEKRRMTEQEIEQYKIMFCSSGVYAGLVIIPIYNEIDELTGWQGRRFGFFGKKSMNPPEMKGQLFNLQGCVGKWGMLLVEGPFDAILTHRHLNEAGIGCVALLGHSISARQSAVIGYVLQPEKVWVMLDPDALDDQMKIVNALRSRGVGEVYRCDLRDKDPDELTHEELVWQLENAKKFL